MKEGLLKARPWAASLAACVALAACSSDSTGPSTSGGFTDETATATIEATAEVTEALADSTVATDVALATQALFALPAADVRGLALAPFAALQSLGQATATLRPQGLRLGGTLEMTDLLPSQILGTTFVWDADNFEYVASDETGAPSDGIRVKVYDTDPLVGMPTSPLTEVGYVDFRDLSAGTTQKLGVKAVRGSTTVAEYSMTGDVTGDDVNGSSDYNADGYLMGGGQRIDFDLNGGGTWTTTTDDEAIDFLVENSSAGVSLHLVDSYSYVGSEPETLTFTIQNGSNTTVVKFEGDDNGGSGDVRYNGKVVIKINSDGDDTSLTNASGGQLSGTQQMAVLRIEEALATVTIFGFSIALPFFAFGGL